MKSQQLIFFAIAEDLTGLLKEFELSSAVQYHRSGLLKKQDIVVYNTHKNIPKFGFASSGDWNRIATYLIVPKSTTVTVRNITQRSGEILYAIDQRENSNTIEVKFGGIVSGGENVIVAGRIATISESKETLQLFKLLSESIKKEFINIEGNYVGEFAEIKLKAGWRLVTNDKLSSDFDLKIK